MREGKILISAVSIKKSFLDIKMILKWLLTHIERMRSAKKSRGLRAVIDSWKFFEKMHACLSQKKMPFCVYFFYVYMLPFWDELKEHFLSTYILPQFQKSLIIDHPHAKAFTNCFCGFFFNNWDIDRNLKLCSGPTEDEFIQIRIIL